MLDSKRLTIIADTMVDEIKIASFGAVLNLENMDLSLTTRYDDKEACKIHRDIVREDRKEFEDLAYRVQDMMKG